MQKEKALENLSENYIIPLIWFCLVRKQSTQELCLEEIVHSKHFFSYWTVESIHILRGMDCDAGEHNNKQSCNSGKEVTLSGFH